MSRMEDLLPQGARYENVLANSYAEIVDEFKDLMGETGSLTDPSLELAYITEEKHFLKSCEILGEIVAMEGDDPNYLEEIVYRSVMFAYQLMHEVDPYRSVRHVPIGGYLRKLVPEGADASAIIYDDVEEYLSTRPAVRQVIADHAEGIDVSEMYHMHIKTIMGLIMMLGEQQQAEKNI